MKMIRVSFVLLLFVGVSFAQKIAITFDDLPLNGELPPGVTRVEIARDTLALLKARHVPAAYGFVNARKLEGNADAAEALKVWAAAEPIGNHTYSHLDLGRQMATLVYGHDINHVLLLHLGAFSSTILPDAFDLLKKKGFELVTLEEAQSDPAYEGDPDAGSKYGGSLLDQWMDARQIKYPAVAQKPYEELKAVCQ